MANGEDITVYFTNAGVPLTSPTNVPTISIRRTDTGALVVTDAAMTELGGGLYRYTVTGLDPQLDYVARADADPLGSGQVTAAERYAHGAIPGISDAYVRKILTNRAVTTNLGGGAKRVDFYDDDGTTIIDSITISADGLERTNP